MPMPRRKNNAIHNKLRKVLALVTSRKLFTQKLLQLRKNKKYNKLFRHYNYSYIGEYQFSPSSTPLISHHYHHGGFSKKRSRRILYLLCGGSGMESMIETNFDFGHFELSPVPVMMNREHEDKRVVEELEWNGGDSVGQTGEQEDQLEGEEDDDSSVDGRAQKFIERFYEEIRLERQQSFIQWKEMLQRSC